MNLDSLYQRNGEFMSAGLLQSFFTYYHVHETYLFSINSFFSITNSQKIMFNEQN